MLDLFYRLSAKKPHTYNHPSGGIRLLIDTIGSTSSKRRFAGFAAIFLAAGSQAATDPVTAEPASQVAPRYVLDYVATAATGFDLNDHGDVIGKAYTDPGCGPFCLPAQEHVLWRDGERIVLPLVPGNSVDSHFPKYLNNDGWIAGELGFATHAAIWTPDNLTGNYIITDLGAPDGMNIASVAGLDEFGRIVLWATTGGAIPTAAASYKWSQETSFVNLAEAGFPNAIPKALSPSGTVLATNAWYRLDDPASTTFLPAPPTGFFAPGNYSGVINDNGDQSHLLVSTSTQNLVYPFRLSADGTWQQLSNSGTGSLSRFGLGSINNDQDVSFTVRSTGVIAAGPDGVEQSLSALVAPSYGGAAVTEGGPMNATGQILVKAVIGRSQRLMKMTPATACASDCIIVDNLVMTGQFVEDPSFPGSCIEGGSMYNETTATLRLTDGNDSPLANVVVNGRFMDDYWTNARVTGQTNAAGVVTFSHTGLCGVGAVAFLAEEAILGTRQFDRTRGNVTGYVIPTPNPPVNQPPVPVATVACSADKTCLFDGTGSSDPDGLVAAFEWREKNGTVVSTEPRFSKTFSKAGKNSMILRVTDNGGQTASAKVTFNIPR